MLLCEQRSQAEMIQAIFLTELVPSIIRKSELFIAVPPVSSGFVRLMITLTLCPLFSESYFILTIYLLASDQTKKRNI